MRHLPTLLITTVLALVPLAVIIEHEYPVAWPNRLYLPEFTPTPDYHTPIYPSGTFLPFTIVEDLTLTINQNPVLLTAPTYISRTATLTIKPGVRVFASENANLVIAGQLIARGTTKQPITFQSNEQHPLNQTWLGLLAQEQSTVELDNVLIEDASPAISCLKDSSVSINHTQLRRGSLGLYQAQATCQIDHSLINGPTIGLVSIDTEPQLNNSSIISSIKEIIQIVTPSATNN